MIPVLFSLCLLTSPSGNAGAARDLGSVTVDGVKEDLKQAGKEIGRGVKKGAKAVGHAAKEGGQAVGRGAKTAGKGIAKGGKEAGRGVKEAVKK